MFNLLKNSKGQKVVSFQKCYEMSIKTFYYSNNLRYIRRKKDYRSTNQESGLASRFLYSFIYRFS